MNKIKVNKKFKPLLTSDSRYFIITGGRASSKSFSTALQIALLIFFESGHTVLFTRYTMKSAHISVIPEFVEKLELLGILDEFEITKDSIVCKRTGSKILFRGIKTSSGEQTANLKSLKGVNIWVLDEGEELRDESIFDKINFSVRVKNTPNKIILLLNPATKEHFIYKKFFEKKGVNAGENKTKGDTTYIHTTYLDNKDNLNESFIKEVEELRETNPEKYNHIILGGWLDKADGVIFNNWKIGNFDDTLPYGYGMDFGFSIDPTTLTKVAVDNKKKIIYVKECLYKAGLSTKEIYDEVKDEVGKQLIIADSAEPRLISELEKLGLNIEKCKKTSVAGELLIMQGYTIVVTEDSPNIVKELNNYSWSNKKAGEPIDSFNHTIDGFRYRFMYTQNKIGFKKYRIR